jgi:hypothetical protein
MSHFLNRLASRAVGVAQIAQPLVPAIFNPGFGVETSQPPSEISVERTTSPAPTRISASEVRSETTLPREWENSATTVPLSSFFASEPPSLVDEHAALPPAVPQTEPPQQTRPQQGQAWPAIRTTLPSVSDEIALASDRAVSPVQSAHDEAPARVCTPRGPEGVPEIFRSNRPSLRALQVRPAVPATSLISARNHAAPISQERPVVRVTIGRIDVRAQFTPAAPGPASSPRKAATLSLDEYLKQRSEGKR